jgi:hypothetical protein
MERAGIDGKNTNVNSRAAFVSTAARNVLPNTTTSTIKLGTLDSDIDLIRRHVTNAKLRLFAQRKLVAFLAARRQPLTQAQELLQLHDETWRAHVDHLSHGRRRSQPSVLPTMSKEVR